MEVCYAHQKIIKYINLSLAQRKSYYSRHMLLYVRRGLWGGGGEGKLNESGRQKLERLHSSRQSMKSYIHWSTPGCKVWFLDSSSFLAERASLLHQRCPHCDTQLEKVTILLVPTGIFHFKTQLPPKRWMQLERNSNVISACGNISIKKRLRRAQLEKDNRIISIY